MFCDNNIVAARKLCTIVFAGGWSYCAVNPTKLTFTTLNWATAQTCTVTGQQTVSANGNVTYHVVFNPATSSDQGYNGILPVNPSLTFINIDYRQPGECT